MVGPKGETHGRQVKTDFGANDAGWGRRSSRFRFQIIQRELTFTYTRNVKTWGALNAVNRLTTTIFSDAPGLLVVQFTMNRTRTSRVAPARAATPASPVVHRTGP
jgi:hypothetical protein